MADDDATTLVARWLAEAVARNERVIVTSPLRAVGCRARIRRASDEELELEVDADTLERVRQGVEEILVTIERDGNRVCFLAELRALRDERFVLGPPICSWDLGRRHSPRVAPPPEEVEAALLTDGGLQQVSVDDISAQGIGIAMKVAEDAPAVGSTVAVRLEREGKALTAMGTVVNVRGFRCGVRFVDAFTRGAIREFARDRLRDWLRPEELETSS